MQFVAYFDKYKILHAPFTYLDKYKLLFAMSYLC